MIRYSLLYLMLGVIIAIGFRNWFWSLCAVILLCAYHDHRYFLEGIMGIKGLKPWNVLLAITFVQWFTQRRQQGLRWDCPPLWQIGFIAYVLVIAYSTAYALTDFDAPARLGWTRMSFIIDKFTNPMLLLLPAIMVYDACRTRRHIFIMLMVLIGLSFLCAIYIIKIIPLSSLADPDSVLKYRHRIDRDLGLFPNDVVSTLVPGFCACLACFGLSKRMWYRLWILGAAVANVIALLLTQSRTGMVTFVTILAVLGIIRWRKPAAVALVVACVAYMSLASLSANWSRGFTDSNSGSSRIDWDEVTNGRLELWAEAWGSISRSPILGYGKLFAERHPEEYSSLTGHPHQAYLEVWLESGLFGLLIVLFGYSAMLCVSLSMIRWPSSSIIFAVGISASAAILNHFIVGLAGRAFMPRVSLVITFCLCALLLRVRLTLRTPQPRLQQSAVGPNRIRRGGEAMSV